MTAWEFRIVSRGVGESVAANSKERKRISGAQGDRQPVVRLGCPAGIAGSSSEKLMCFHCPAPRKTHKMWVEVTLVRSSCERKEPAHSPSVFPHTPDSRHPLEVAPALGTRVPENVHNAEPQLTNPQEMWF